MKKLLLITVLSCIVFNCSRNAKNEPQKPSKVKVNEFAIVIHGGAGTILKKNMTPEKEAEYNAKLGEAVKTGYTILKNGGSSLDAVEKTINILEDSPLFNAGAGASAGTKTVKNPINLARKIMENSPHVMMAGDGAETFAIEQGLDIVPPEYFFTENRLNTLKRVKERETKKKKNRDITSAFYDADIKDSKFGTVGCVALDKNGNLAAGTSTGGMTNKRYGRVGDVPIIGAGNYANNATCAVSGTGWGEYFIRATVAHDISALMEYKGLSLKEAAHEVIQKKVPNLGGNGGIIAVDKNGNMVMDFNTAGMYRATMNDMGELVVKIFKE